MKPMEGGVNPAGVEALITELIRIGKDIGYLGEKAGGAFNEKCRNARAKEIGELLHAIGGIELMRSASQRVRDALGGVAERELRDGRDQKDIGRTREAGSWAFRSLWSLRSFCLIARPFANDRAWLLDDRLSRGNFCLTGGGAGGTLSPGAGGNKGTLSHGW